MTSTISHDLQIDFEDAAANTKVLKLTASKNGTISAEFAGRLAASYFSNDLKALESAILIRAFFYMPAFLVLILLPTMHVPRLWHHSRGSKWIKLYHPRHFNKVAFAALSLINIGLVLYGTYVSRDPDYGVPIVYVAWTYLYIPASMSTLHLNALVVLLTHNVMFVCINTDWDEFTEDDSHWRCNHDYSLQVLEKSAIFTCVVIVQAWHRFRNERYQRESLIAELLRVEQSKSLMHAANTSNRIIDTILPSVVVRALMAGEKTYREAIEAATVLFCQVCGYDSLCEKYDAETVISILNCIYTEFDTMVDAHKVLKVETVNEVYMAVSGAPVECENHAELASNLALAMMGAMPKIRATIARVVGSCPDDLNIRVGLSSGFVLSGVVGLSNLRYKLIGDTVNTASRMESNCDPGKIQLSESTKRLLDGKGYSVSKVHPPKEIKGKGIMTTYWLSGTQAAEAKQIDLVPKANAKGVMQKLRMSRKVKLTGISEATRRRLSVRRTSSERTGSGAHRSAATFICCATTAPRAQVLLE